MQFIANTQAKSVVVTNLPMGSIAALRSNLRQHRNDQFSAAEADENSYYVFSAAGESALVEKIPKQFLEIFDPYKPTCSSQILEARDIIAIFSLVSNAVDKTGVTIMPNGISTIMDKFIAKRSRRTTHKLASMISQNVKISLPVELHTL